jgi:hypothetical protein
MNFRQATPLYCANNYQLTSLLFGDQCIFNVITNDPNITVDYSINPDDGGIDFQSNVPITIVYQFTCTVYLRYICLAGTQSNVNRFSYMIFDIDQNIIGEGVITRLTAKECTPRPIPTVELASQLVITIDETTDGQPPRDIRIDIQSCLSVSVSTIISFLFESVSTLLSSHHHHQDQLFLIISKYILYRGFHHHW